MYDRAFVTRKAVYAARKVIYSIPHTRATTGTTIVLRRELHLRKRTGRQARLTGVIYPELARDGQTVQKANFAIRIRPRRLARHAQLWTGETYATIGKLSSPS